MSVPCENAHLSLLSHLCAHHQVRPLRVSFYSAHELRVGRHGVYDKAWQDAVKAQDATQGEGVEGTSAFAASSSTSSTAATGIPNASGKDGPAPVRDGSKLAANAGIPGYETTVSDFHIETHAQPHFCMPKTLEFELARTWRLTTQRHAYEAAALRQRQNKELAEEFRECVGAWGAVVALLKDRPRDHDHYLPGGSVSVSNGV